MIGGYKIIDFGGYSFTSGVGHVIEGIYDSIESSNKAILIEGLVIANTEYRPTYVDFTHSGTTYTGTIYGNTITIADTDTITITVA